MPHPLTPAQLVTQSQATLDQSWEGWVDYLATFTDEEIVRWGQELADRARSGEGAVARDADLSHLALTEASHRLARRRVGGVA
jgi:hypothetical protein